ncbi:MAG: type I-C CRISPR-associated protein Cas8c/Csd1, partial [Desulforhabdus sp.]|nr:type I-C CRISPR-associated protein Cas8c/Csd1 [Desulforhabdus sp.]
MILQALHDYYHRMQAEGLVDLASEGFERKGIPFLLVLNREGRFLDLQDTRLQEGPRKVAREFIVPMAVKKTIGIAANVLWGPSSYVFGRSKPEPNKDPAKFLDRTRKQKERFLNTIQERLIAVLDDEGVAAVVSFLQREEFDNVFAHPSWPEIEEKGRLLTFQLNSDNCIVCERPQVVAAIKSNMTIGQDQQACLITGKIDESARLHTAIKGVKGAQPSGANIISFNLPAFTSYGKQQSYNAPVGKRAEFAYTTALNHLLKRDSSQRLLVGDTTVAYWAEQKHDIEGVFAELFGEPAKGEPEQDYRQLAALFRSPEAGIPPEHNPDTRFFVLGLSPNAARLAVRFWYAGSVREVADHLWQHFDDLELAKDLKEWRSISIKNLLRSIVHQGKDENIPPNLAGDTMKAILLGMPYPQTLLVTAIRRCRAEREITYTRAALIKAVLVRDNRSEKRYSNHQTKEVGMS